MTRRATSRKRNIGLGWLTEKKVTYRARVVRPSHARQAVDAEEKRREKEAYDFQMEVQRDLAYNTGARHKREGKKPVPVRMVTTEAAKKLLGVRKAEMIARSSYMVGYRQNPECAVTRQSKVTDRAKRYRANQRGCKPAGVKKCKLCPTRTDLMVDHIDGNESNGRKSNLRWLCRSCNTAIGAEMARTGQGRRTAQYNPKVDKGGAQNLYQYMLAVLEHTRGAHDAAGKIIHATPKAKRREYASQFWDARRAHERSHSDERYYSGNPQRPQSSTEFTLGYNLGQRDRDTATLRKTLPELHSTFGANFAAAPDANWEWFEEGYVSGYSGAMGTAVPNPRHETPFQYKGVTITPVPPTFVRYDVALPSGTIRVSSIQDAKDWVSRSLDPRFTHTARGNPETIYKTRAAAQSAWYDSAPGRNDRATFKKVRGGWVIKVASRWNPQSNWGYAVFYNKPGSPYLSQEQVAFYSTSAEAKADAKGRNADLKASDPSAYYSGGQYTSRKAIRASNPPARRNAETEGEEYSQAKKIAELFHGRPVKEEIVIDELVRQHDWYWRIGPMVSLKVKTLTGQKITIPFSMTEQGMVHLFCSPDGRQFYLRGGDQELDLDAIDMGSGSEWYRDHMIIGDATEITYQDKKRFHRFKITEYFHRLGEVTKKKPQLLYDAFAKKLQIVGGQYRVETEDLVDLMSPGIVN